MPILTDVSITEYHACGVLSKSKIMDFIKYGPMDYYHRHVALTIPRVETDAMRLGRLFDGLMDNEDRERDRWASPLPDDAPRRPSDRERFAKKPSPETLERCKWWDDYLAANHGKEVVDAEDRHKLEDMSASLLANQHFARLWPMCQRQVTIRRELPEFGISLQSRPDGLCLEGDKFLLDVKSVHCMDAFAKQAIALGYNIQLAIGQWLLAKDGHQVEAYLGVTESKEKGRSRVYRLPDVALDAGWQTTKKAVADIAQRMKSGDWSDPQESIEELRLPEWQTKQLEAITI